jgi:predicted kinase
MKTIWLMVGISGSGKSVMAQKIAEALKVPRISSDEIRGELCNGDMTDQSKNYQVFQTAFSRTKEALQKGDVVVDATNKSVKERKEFRKIAIDCDARIVAVVMDTIIEECLDKNSKRDRVVPEDVIHRQFSQLVIPTLEEVSQVIRVDWIADQVSNNKKTTTIEQFLKELSDPNYYA